jgi:hypothetical protein
MTNTTWHDVLIRIGEIITGISATLTVKPYVPRQIDPTKFPFIVLVPNGMTGQPVSADRNNEVRQFSIEVYLADARGGTEFEKEEEALDYDLLDTIPQEFYARPRLELNDNGVVGVQVRVVGDTGIRQIPFPQNSDNLYLGFILTISVTRSITQRLKRSANS